MDILYISFEISFLISHGLEHKVYFQMLKAKRTCKVCIFLVIFGGTYEQAAGENKCLTLDLVLQTWPTCTLTAIVSLRFLLCAGYKLKTSYVFFHLK